MAAGIAAVLAAFDAYTNGLEKRVEICIQTVVGALEGWAKSEHSYTDRTSNLTNSIKGIVGEVSATGGVGYLTATMEYAVFVELARDGKWAFLWPVIEGHREDIMKIIESQLGGTALGGGGVNPSLQADYEAFKAS